MGEVPAVPGRRMGDGYRGPSPRPLEGEPPEDFPAAKLAGAEANLRGHV